MPRHRNDRPSHGCLWHSNSKLAGVCSKIKEGLVKDDSFANDDVDVQDFLTTSWAVFAYGSHKSTVPEALALSNVHDALGLGTKLLVEEKVKRADHEATARISAQMNNKTKIKKTLF